VLSLPGCGDKPSPDKDKPKEDKPKLSKLEYFKQKQGPTVTPHGQVLAETARETSDGRIEYKTKDGKTWRVEMTANADGTYSYGEPQEVK
jgi:hypothetical protein